MKQKLITYTVIGILSFQLFGCQKEKVDSEGKVELFLLDSYSKFENSYQIDEKTVKTKASPLISYSDFISYDSSDYEFQISNKAKNAIDQVELSVHGVAFAVKANGILIYSGYFWPNYSSASCDCVVIDPIMTSIDNKIKVCLGYPGLIQGQVIPDNRNDSRIIVIFEKDNKLIK